MFQFRPFPSYTYLIQCTILEYCSSGFPHSEIPGSMDICSSPRLIAACHVLRRLLMPRHSPCALFSLTNQKRYARSRCWIMQAFTVFLEIVIVTLHPFGCLPQLNIFALPDFHLKDLSVALLFLLSLCSVFKVHALTLSLRLELNTRFTSSI